jgi:LCP family protein required for cell wall assembly
MSRDGSPPAPRGRARRAFLVTSTVLSFVLALSGAAAGGLFVWANGELSKGDVPSGIDPNTGEKIIGGPCQEHGCNILILGSDSRTGLSAAEIEHFGTDEQINGQRSDTIILVHLPPGGGRATIVHFPRDLWVRVAGEGWGKINSAFEGGVKHGGPDRVARTITNLTGLHINHFLFVNLAGFEGIVNAMGGVPICIDRPMIDPKVELNLTHAGCYTLNGHDALAFVRTRSQLCDARNPDFGRIARQQQFLRAVLAKVLSPGQLTHVLDIVPEVGKQLIKDDQLPIAELVALANELKGVSSGDADFRVVTGHSELIHPADFPNGLAIVRMDPSANELFRRLREGKPLGNLGLQQEDVPPSPAIIDTGVVDRASDGKAADVISFLSQSGFLTGTAPLDATAAAQLPARPAIYYRPGAEQEAEVVHGYLPGLRVVAADGSLPGGLDVAVVVAASSDVTPPGSGGGAQPPPACP